MEEIRIVFMGTPKFACSILQALIDMHCHIVAAVSQPDRPVGRKQILTASPVHQLAQQHGIPVLEPEHLKTEYQPLLDCQPDLIVTCAYGQMVPEIVLQAPKYGCINFHPSLLPKYRGGAPVHHAVWNGDTVTGVSMMEMVKAMDAGRVYAQNTVAIGPDETTEELNTALEQAAVCLLKENLPLYLAGQLPGTVQSEADVTIARNISREQEQIHFASEALPELYNHVRALIDWPVSYGLVNGHRIKFLQARRQDGTPAQLPGTILGFQDHAMQIACLGGTLQVFQLQPEGKRVMKADEFANGAGRQLIGKRFD